MVDMQTCPACHGTRAVANAQTGAPTQCPVCQATGRVEPNYQRLPFFYVINQVLTALGQSAGALQIEPRADFEAIWLMATSTGAFTTQITDSGGRIWQNLAVNNANQWGTAQNPAPLIVPVVLKQRTSLNWILIDTSGGGNTVQLVIGGFELYPIVEV